MPSLTPQRLESLARLRSEFTEYAPKCLKIRTKSGKVKPFALNRAQLPRIFKPKCPNCQVNHLQRAMKRARAAHDYVHPGAITSLRKAMVPDYLMCQVWIVNEDVPPENASEEQQKAFRKRMNFMPFWRGDADRTLAAQIAFALQYQSKKSMGRPLGRPSKAAMIYLNPSPLIVPNQEKAS